MATTAVRTRETVENENARDRLWNSLDYSYGKKREASDRAYDKEQSAASRNMLKRGMQRSSYAAQTVANIGQEKIRAQGDIYDQQIAEYGNRLQEIERQEKQDEQWERQFAEGQRQFNENMGFQKDRAATQDKQWAAEFGETQKQNQWQRDFSSQQFEYQKGRDAVADQQWQTSFDYQKGRDAVADSQWQQATIQILSYAQSPSVRQMLADTRLHTIVMQFRGYDLERLEEIG